MRVEGGVPGGWLSTIVFVAVLAGFFWSMRWTLPGVTRVVARWLAGPWWRGVLVALGVHVVVGLVAAVGFVVAALLADAPPWGVLVMPVGIAVGALGWAHTRAGVFAKRGPSLGVHLREAGASPGAVVAYLVTGIPFVWWELFSGVVTAWALPLGLA